MNTNESLKREEYGKINGHFRWDLAKDFILMTKSEFTKKYNFYWTPPMFMQMEVMKYI